MPQNVPTRIYRSRTIMLTMVVGYASFILLWLMHELGIVKIEGASSLPFRLFILGFVFPGYLLLTFIWMSRRRPLLILDLDALEMRSGWLLTHSIVLPYETIKTVSTNWTGYNEDSPSDLIFRLSDQGQRLAEASKVLRTNGETWSFLFAPAEIPPPSAVELIASRIGCDKVAVSANDRSKYGSH